MALLASLVPTVLQRRWATTDRQRAYDAKALDSAVDKLMAWQDLATKLLNGSPIDEPHRRLQELDASWQSDFQLIPDQASVRRLRRLTLDIYFSLNARMRPNRFDEFNELLVLSDAVIASAQKRRRELA